MSFLYVFSSFWRFQHTWHSNLCLDTNISSAFFLCWYKSLLIALLYFIYNFRTWNPYIRCFKEIQYTFIPISTKRYEKKRYIEPKDRTPKYAKHWLAPNIMQFDNNISIRIPSKSHTVFPYCSIFQTKNQHI